MKCYVCKQDVNSGIEKSFLKLNCWGEAIESKLRLVCENCEGKLILDKCHFVIGVKKEELK